MIDNAEKLTRSMGRRQGRRRDGGGAVVVALLLRPRRRQEPLNDGVPASAEAVNGLDSGHALQFVWILQTGKQQQQQQNCS